MNKYEIKTLHYTLILIKATIKVLSVSDFVCFVALLTLKE